MSPYRKSKCSPYLYLVIIIERALICSRTSSLLAQRQTIPQMMMYIIFDWHRYNRVIFALNVKLIIESGYHSTSFNYFPSNLAHRILSASV